MEESTPRFFFNDFVSKILFNDGLISAEEACRAKLQEVSFVNIKMPTSDAIVLRRDRVSGIAWLTEIGGLLSLYTGFSSISVFEILFILVSVIRCKRASNGHD